MKVGVYVGSFDPIHKGHLGVINHLLCAKYVDKIIVVPGNSYWDKKLKVDLNTRIKMLRNFECENIIIDDRHNSLDYTYQVLQALQNENEEYDLHLIMGDDLLVSLDKWKHLEELLKFKIIVMKRNESKVKVDKYNENKNFIIVEDYNVLNISSTYIRENLYRLSKCEMCELLDEKTYDIIIENGLYL